MNETGNYVLSSASLRCEFDRTTGALVHLTAPETDWSIMDRAALGLSFRLMVPLSESLRNNNVHGEKQPLSAVEEQADALVFHWNGLDSERGGHLSIDVTVRVAVEDRQIVYYTHIENHSDYTVETVYCPYLGDIRPPHGADWLKTFTWGYASANESNIWPRFDNYHGYFGVDYPTQFICRTPTNPFCLLRSERQGLYAGIKENSSELVVWNIELRPGYESSIDAWRPQTDEIAGKPVHTPFATIHLPYILAGESRDLTPVALEAFSGGWHAGADIYKEWRDTWYKHAEAPEWARNPHAWQQLHINSPEDELRMRFTELPTVAEECKKYGVAAIQLVGWNDGGQDQGNPSHNPDPRLGTWDELTKAIAQCHAIGVKIILFAKFTWADRATDWFRNELHQLAVTDPYGDCYVYPGYQYQTATQLSDINTKRLIPMCFHSEAYMQVCEREFQKLIDLGAAGILFDECQHHSPTWLCFNTEHGHRYGAPTYAKDRDFIQRMRKLPRISDDFLTAGEACYDGEMEAYQVAYHRSEHTGHTPVSRYLQPKAQYMTAVTGFNDRNMINQCLLYRYIISYEPYNFKGRLDDYPDTVAYGVQMDALRTHYRKWFWDGICRDTCGAAVIKEDGSVHAPYAAYQADDGSIALVICNYADEAITVHAKAHGATFGTYRTVDDDTMHDASGAITIPARSAAVVLPA